MELIGNKETMAQLGIAQISAQKRDRAIPHTLLTGAAGCGKTSTARHTAEMSGGDIINAAPDSLKTRLDVALLMSKCSKSGYTDSGELINPKAIMPSIVFIDEVHNLSLLAQEYLGILMEEWRIPITIKEAHTLKVQMDENLGLFMYWVPQFTLMGATTNDGRLSKPFRDRFKLRFVFTPYSLDESIQIVLVHAERLEIEIDEGGAIEIAKRGRGVPRILVSLLERCRDAVLVMNQERITKEAAAVACFKMGIDAAGLTKTDISLLRTLHKIGDPVGLDNLATILNESPKVLSEAVEPHLIQKGLMLRASRGRTITDKGSKYLSDKGHITKESKFERKAISKSFDRGF